MCMFNKSMNVSIKTIQKEQQIHNNYTKKYK